MKPSKPKVATPASTELYQTSDDALFTDLSLAVLGPRKVGKSHLAATASDSYPAALGAKKIVLDDIAWIAFDNGATDFMAPWKLTCPYVFNMHKLTAQYGSLIDATRRTLEAIGDLHATGKISWAVADTVTVFDRMLGKHYGDLEKWERFNAMLQAHLSFQHNLALTGPRTVLLFHTKALVEPSGKGEAIDAAKKKAAVDKKAKYSELPEIVPDITGQGGHAYLANVSAQIVVLLKKTPEGKKTRRMYLEMMQGFEAGNRWEPVFAENAKEGLEPNLGTMMRKVKDYARD